MLEGVNVVSEFDQGRQENDRDFFAWDVNGWRG